MPFLRRDTNINGAGNDKHRLMVLDKVQEMRDRTTRVEFLGEGMGQMGQKSMKLPATLRRDMGMGRDVNRKKRRPTVPHEKSLQRLWRQVVLAEWGGRCALSNSLLLDCEGTVECHHIKPRRIPHLRHCPTNGVPLCQYHHGLAKLRVWRNKIEAAAGAGKMEWLDAQEQLLFPEFLAEHSQTRDEYLRGQFAYLKDLLKGYE